MARDPYLDMRLKRWAKWLWGKSGGLGFASVNWDAWHSEGDEGREARAIVPDDEEAITDQAVRSLARDPQAALCAEYCDPGSTERKAQRLGCHVQTYRDRVNTGLRGVSRWLTERARGQEAERERVEALRRFASEELAHRDARARDERARSDAAQYAGKAARKTLRLVRKRGLGATEG
jgi:hypothetical protein